MRRGPTALVTVTLVALALAGCGRRWLPISDDGRWLAGPVGSGLVADLASPIPDVPMPVGFVAIGAKSHASVVGGVRIVEHLYQGRATVADARAFYQRQAALHGWRAIGGEQVGDTAVQQYTKGSERLRVAVSDRGGLLSIRIGIGAADPTASPVDLDPNL